MFKSICVWNYIITIFHQTMKQCYCFVIVIIYINVIIIITTMLCYCNYLHRFMNKFFQFSCRLKLISSDNSLFQLNFYLKLKQTINNLLAKRNIYAMLKAIFSFYLQIFQQRYHYFCHKKSTVFAISFGNCRVLN